PAADRPNATDLSADPTSALSPTGVFRDSLGWYLGISSYWFATSLKWFILFLLQPLQVASVVPGGEKNGAWGLVVALGATEAMIGPALMGYLSDRCGSRWGRRRPFIAIGAALTAVALLFLGQASSLWMMIAGYLFLQISDDVATGPYSAIIPDVVPKNHRGRASGIMSLLQLVAQIAAVAIALPLGNFFYIYTAVAVINILCALIVLRVIREPRFVFPVGAGPVATPASQATLWVRMQRGAAHWLAPFRSADFRWVWFTRFLCAFGFYLILLYVSNYLTDRVETFRVLGLNVGSVKNAALVAGLAISLAGAAASVPAGKLADRIGRKKVVVFAGWLMFATLVPFALVPNYTVIIALALLFGIGYGAYLSASWALATDVLPSKEDAAKDMGIWQASVATPQILTGAVGFLVDAGNKVGTGMGYTFAFLLSAVMFLMGCLLVTKVKGST
ncbi:MAG: MFS transporter, partial [Cytophagales bacterium]|nr:MFS transporter [Armatimonadota bacterium]